jgi:hypothetical protein
MAKRGKQTKSKRKRQNNNNNQRQKVVYVKQPQLSIGAQIGDKLQKLGTSLFTRFMGTGDYTANDGAVEVKKNALIKGSDAKAVRMGNDKSTFIFEHSEYIADVVSSPTIGGFQQSSYVCNPINSQSFPWLCNLAGSFETYEIVGLMYRFVSTSGESVGSTNTALGTVMGTFVYDSMDPAFVSKQQLLQYDDTVSCKTSSNFICGVECDPSRLPTFSNKLYIGTPPTGADPKMYNFGNFVIATSGMQAASVVIGELYVSYVIKMHITKDTNYVPGSGRAVIQGTGPTTPLLTLAATKGSIAISIDSPNNKIVVKGTQPGSKYLISFKYGSAVSGNWVYQKPPTTNAGFVYFNGYTIVNASDTTGNGASNFTGSEASLGYSIQAISDTLNITYPYTSVPTTTIYNNFYINELDGTIDY